MFLGNSLFYFSRFRDILLFFGNFSILLCFSDLASCHIIQFLGKFSILPFYTSASRRGRGVYCFTSARLSVRPSIQDNFLSNCWWQKSDIWSQASCRYTILWVAFLDPSDSYFLFADLVGFYTHWTYMYIFLSNYWWQKSYIWSQASYRYPISWEAFLDPSDSYFLFAEERGYHKWALAHSSSCLISFYRFLGGNSLFLLYISGLSITVWLSWHIPRM